MLSKTSEDNRRLNGKLKYQSQNFSEIALHISFFGMDFLRGMKS